MSVVGLDVGNQNAVIAAARQGGIEVLTNEYTYRLTPALVSYGQKERFIGEAARPQLSTNPKNTISQFKRLIGRQYSDPEVQEELKSAPFRHEALPDGGVGIKVMFRGQELVLSAEQVYGSFLTQLKKIAETGLKKPILDVVVSSPNWFNDFQRRAIKNACKFAGLNCVRVINDTTAMALAYGIYKNNLSETDPLYVAFVDVGHSSLQVAIVGFVKGRLTVKATAADRNLGGRDFDNVLYEHFRKEFQDKYKVDLNERPRSRIRLMAECEKLKKLMSANTSSLPINVECLTDEHDFHSRLSREEFETMAADVLARVKAPLERCVQESGLTTDQIDTVEIVGGSTRVPAVKDRIMQVFGKEPSTTLNADEVVARGCALQAAIVSPTFRVREMKIEDSVPYSMDLIWLSPSGEENKNTVFAKNSIIPSTKMLTFKRSEPFEMSVVYTNPEEVPGHPNLIGRFRIGGVTPDANGEPMKIKIRVRCNASGIVGVESAIAHEEVVVEAAPEEAKAEPMDTGAAKEEGAPPADQMETDKPAANTEAPAPGAMETDADKAAAEPKKQVKKMALPVEALDAMSDSAINKAHELETQMALEDRMEHERVDAKNALEEFVYDARDKIDGMLADFISEDHRSKVSEALTKMEDWLYDEGEEESKKTYQAKLEELKSLVRPVSTRAREWSELPAAEEAIRTALVRFRKAVDQYKNKDEKYEHLLAEEMEKVAKEVEAVDTWLNAEVAHNAKKNKTEDPVLTCSMIHDRRQALESTCNTVLNKPKPKPATPPPAPAAAEGEAAPAEGSAPAPEGAAADDADANKPKGDMDVD